MDKRGETVTNNMGLVHACAKRFKGRGIEYDDLFQAGCVGLVKAVDGFDVERGLQLSTYAVPVILGEIKRLFRDGGAVKISRGLKDLSIKTTRICEEFYKQEGRELTISELAQRLNVDPTEAAEALGAARIPLSLTGDSDDGESQIDIPVESHDEKVSEMLALKQSIGELPKNDRAIIVLRFFKHQTQTETAKALGMTQVQVSRREKVILKNLRMRLM